MARQQPAMPTNEEAEAEAEVATAPNQASRGSQATGNAPSMNAFNACICTGYYSSHTLTQLLT